jgi:hypothetical protein
VRKEKLIKHLKSFLFSYVLVTTRIRFIYELQNQRVMRDLYIVQSRHFISSSSVNDELYKPTLEVQKASRGIAEELILREGIERFFMDGIDAEFSEYLNSILSDERKLKNPKKPHSQMLVNWTRMLQNCREQGVDVSYAETEHEGLLDLACKEYPYRETIRWVNKNGNYRVNQKFQKKVVEDILDSRLYLRDHWVFRNVREHGTKANLLWIGKAHRLEDFYRKRNGFRVATVVLEDDLSYDIQLANRNMPDYLPDLVERSIAKAKEEVQLELSDVA